MIRKATVFDANELTRMWVAMADEIFTKPHLRKEYDNVTNLFTVMVTRIQLPEWGVVVAEVDGKIAGFTMGRIRYPLYHNCHVILECEVIYVYPGYRNMGIHLELLEKGTAWGKENNATQFEFTGPFNDVAMRFWDKLGYEPVHITYRQKEGL